MPLWWRIVRMDRVCQWRIEIDLRPGSQSWEGKVEAEKEKRKR